MLKNSRMIRTLIVFMLSILFSFSGVSQDKADVFNPNTEITWLGLDFTGAKFIGDRERLGSESDIRHLIDAINELMINEADKYNVAAAIQKKTVDKENDVTNEHKAETEVLKSEERRVGKEYKLQ